MAHRRAGKTVACINDLIKRALKIKRKDGRFAYLAPYYAQAKDVAWSYLLKYTAPIPGVKSNVSELRVDFPNGSRIRLYGAENADRLRGIYLDGIVIDEPADISPRVFPEIIRPALSDRGGWATFIGTPKGHNAFYHTYKNSVHYEQNGKLKKPVILVLDEAYSLGYCEPIEQGINILLGAGCEIYLCFQSPSQLNIYPEAEAIKGMCGVWQISGGEMNPKLSSEISELIGDTTVYSGSENKGEYGKSKGKSETGRRLLKPEELRQLDEGEQIVLYKNLNIRCDKAFYWSDKRMQKLLSDATEAALRKKQKEIREASIRSSESQD